MPTATLFSHQTYKAVLMGKQVYQMGYAKGDLASAFALDEERWWNYVLDHRSRCADFTAASPDHRQLLRDIRGEMSSRERRALKRGETIAPEARPELEVSENSLL